MQNKKVILLADIHDSFPNLNSEDKQEWESKKSIYYLIETIFNLGYDVVLLEPKKGKLAVLETLKSILENPNIDCILFNLIEGFRSRNREGYIPAIGEFLGIAYTGSDAYAQNISLDKHLTKLIINDLAIPTKKSYLIQSILDLPRIPNFPLFLKPNGEGSSLGVGNASIVRNSAELATKVGKLLEKFDSILVEEFLEGEDLTLGVIGNYPNYEATSVGILSYPSQVYGEEIKSKDSMPETISFTLDKILEKKIQQDSIRICQRLKVFGYARLDWKLDTKGNPFFLEINLTPGLSRYYSSLPICYEESLGKYSDLIKKVLQFGYDNYNTNKFFDYGKLEKI